MLIEPVADDGRERLEVALGLNKSSKYFDENFLFIYFRSIFDKLKE